ncbi:hypothetical protein ACWD4G_33445 [Streptomyces sp. NPDC002643]
MNGANPANGDRDAQDLSGSRAPYGGDGAVRGQEREWERGQEHAQAQARPQGQGQGQTQRQGQGQPNVYRPVADTGSLPAYGTFKDPAAAHGWLNAYDDTVQLDEIVTDDPDHPDHTDGVVGVGGTGDSGGRPAWGAPGVRDGAGEYSAARAGTYHGGAFPEAELPEAEGGSYAADAGHVVGRRARPVDGRRVSLGRRRARRRGVLVAIGIGVAVLAGAAVAGLIGLGSPQGGSGDPAPRNSAPADDRSDDTGSSTRSPGDSATPDQPTQPTTAHPDRTPTTSSPDSTPTPSTPPPTPTTPQPTSPSTTSPPPTQTTSANKPGRGQGATKKPR